MKIFQSNDSNFRRLCVSGNKVVSTATEVPSQVFVVHIGIFMKNFNSKFFIPSNRNRKISAVGPYAAFSDVKCLRLRLYGMSAAVLTEGSLIWGHPI
jgi:hypothetical protein